jgi:peptidoglycan/xylan/chitin deacetylase (PgdA/CDA1 family)
VKRSLVWLLVLACVLGPLPGETLAEGAKWLQIRERPLGYVSITFDDATASQFTAGYPILAEAGLPATVYVNTAPLDAGDTYFMSWDDVRILKAAGWEIGAHAVTHRSLPSLGDVEVAGEVVLARDRIEAEIGVRPSSFALPFGDYDERIMVYVTRYFETNVLAWRSEEAVNTVAVDPYRIARVNVDTTLTVEQVCSMVRSVGEGEWLVLMLHQVRPLRSPDESFVTTPEHLFGIANCIAELVHKKAVTADTVSAVLQQLKKE